MIKNITYIVGFVCFVLVIGAVVINRLDEPIAMVNGKRQCEYFTTIENGREVEGKCPQNWKKFQVKHISSKKELEEMQMYLAGKKVLQKDEEEILVSLKKELEKRARIAQRE